MDDKITSEEMDKKITTQVTDRIRFLYEPVLFNTFSKTSELKDIQSQGPFVTRFMLHI